MLGAMLKDISLGLTDIQRYACPLQVCAETVSSVCHSSTAGWELLMGPSTDDQQGLMMVVMVMNQMFWALHCRPVALRKRLSADLHVFIFVSVVWFLK